MNFLSDVDNIKYIKNSTQISVYLWIIFWIFSSILKVTICLEMHKDPIMNNNFIYMKIIWRHKNLAQDSSEVRNQGKGGGGSSSNFLKFILSSGPKFGEKGTRTFSLPSPISDNVTGSRKLSSWIKFLTIRKISCNWHQL